MQKEENIDKNEQIPEKTLSRKRGDVISTSSFILKLYSILSVIFRLRWSRIQNTQKF